MKKYIISTILLCILTILTSCALLEPTKKDVKKFLKEHLYEPYEFINDGNEKDNNYAIYLPDSNLTVNVTCKKEYNGAINKHWVIDIDNYYSEKFLSHSDERTKLLEKKYPDIKEEILYNSDGNLDGLKLKINSKDNYEELYNYLIDIYKLNDFKLYSSYSKVGNEFKALFWQDFIFIQCYCGDEYIYYSYFSDLRKNERCLPEELNDMISFDEFLKKIEE